MTRLAFVGFMGVGKSTLATEIARISDFTSLDLDELVVEMTGQTIPEVFSTRGEGEFRRLEHEALLHLSEHRESIVLATGGGVVTYEPSFDVLRDDWHVVYLSASVDTLVEHLAGREATRPMLQGAPLAERIEDLLHLRESLYKRLAHDQVSVDGKSVSELAREILRLASSV